MPGKSTATTTNTPSVRRSTKTATPGSCLCLTGSFNSNSKYRGWCLRIDKDGHAIPTCSGIRSPGGIGMNAEGDVFFTDNQGPWNGTCSLKWLRPGSFQGHPAGNRWYDLPEVKKAMGEKPQEPESGSRIMTEAKKIPEYEPPAVLFPYDKMGKSAAGIACDLTGGKFGPFAGQMMVTDQSFSTVMRCYLEKIQGHYQGACFMLREGGGSGNLVLDFAHDGSLHRRRHESRLGLARPQTLRFGTPGLDRQDAV